MLNVTNPNSLAEVSPRLIILEVIMILIMKISESKTRIARDYLGDSIFFMHYLCTYLRNLKLKLFKIGAKCKMSFYYLLF